MESAVEDFFGNAALLLLYIRIECMRVAVCVCVSKFEKRTINKET